MYAHDNNSLPVWIILSQAHHHITINSQPFLVGIVLLGNDLELTFNKNKNLLMGPNIWSVDLGASNYMTPPMYGMIAANNITSEAT